MAAPAGVLNELQEAGFGLFATATTDSRFEALRRNWIAAPRSPASKPRAGTCNVRRSRTCPTCRWAKLCAAVLARLSPETAADLDGLLHVSLIGGADTGAENGDRAPPPVLALRAGTAPASLKSVDEEAAKQGRRRRAG